VLQLGLDYPLIAPGTQNVHKNKSFVLKKIHDTWFGRDMHATREILESFHLEFKNMSKRFSVRVEQGDVIHPLQNIVKIKVFGEQVDFRWDDNPIIITFKGLSGDKD